LGDIGDLFPDSDPRNRDADSRDFLRNVSVRVRRAGFAVENVDVIIHAERPRLDERKAAIRRSLSHLLETDEACVGVKATTNEGLGFVGRGEAIACWASVLLRAVPSTNGTD
jgi:2-C-methyl-D-erythritol 2,4-cyclodiphosphate synthase